MTNNVSSFTHTFLSKIRPEDRVNACSGMESRGEGRGPDRTELGATLVDWHAVDHLVALKYVSSAGLTSPTR